MIDASGIGSYLRGCLPWFLQTNNDFFLLGNEERLHTFSSNKKVNIIGCNIKPFSIKELILFSLKISRQINNTDLFFSPFFNIPKNIKIPIYTTIHDIIFPDLPEYVSKIGLVVRMWFLRRAYRKSKKIFTVSHFSKSRIEHHLGKEKPVIVTYESIQPIFFEDQANNTKKQKTETIVFIGNIKKHKGLHYLLDAFQLARNEGLPHKLIIIGSKDKFRTADDSIMTKVDSISPGTVIFTGYVSDDELIEYLSSAALLVQPSLYEGFGLPPLEAMVLGTPALISDIPVFKEIYADYPVTFFRARDSDDLKEKLIAILLKMPDKTIFLSDYLKEKYSFKKTASVVLQNFN
jgi:glycosyltransferase involved in cell wall biosynthesis